MPLAPRHTITAALPYANGPVHIGHLAGVYIPADIYVRYLRMAGEEVLFVCGSDEHGVPITIRAQKEGITPQEVVDKYHAQIRDSFQDFGIKFDVYSRTSKDIHRQTSQAFFTRLNQAGQLQVQPSEQFYDEAAGQFLADRYIVGTCPVCANPGAYGDQCERCGTSLSPDELINPHSALSGSALVRRPTSHWYLPLNEYETWLREWILDGHREWKSNVYGQVKSWLDQGLHPRAVTRDLDWGVPVPVDGAEGKVLYVWFDAPIGYISATCDWATETTGRDWQKWWKRQPEEKDNARLVHFIGKDNIVFHCIIFPVMLKAHGEFILPENVPANEFMNLEGEKISTSRNWAVWLHEYLADFPGKQDALRYALTATLPEQKDNDFTWRDFQMRNNSELVAILGNFVNRALVLAGKYFGGTLPPFAGNAQPVDMALVEVLMAAPDRIGQKIEAFRFREALAEMMDVARAGNKYMADCEPWKTAKTDMDRTAQVLHLSLQLCAGLSLLMEPFLPYSSEKLKKMLGLQGNYHYQEGGRMDLLRPGHKLGEVGLLFEKIEDEAIAHQIEKLQKMSNQTAPTSPQGPPDIRPEKGNENAPLAPPAPPFTIDDFGRMHLRVGTVTHAERIPKADKLLHLTVDLGEESGPRTILSGIAESFSPEEVTGRQVVVVANLPPRKMRGLESQGMILMAEDPATGKLQFVAPTAAMAPGAEVR